MEHDSGDIPPNPPYSQHPARKPDRTWPVLCHLSALAMFALPFGNIVGPAVVWMMRRDDDAEVMIHGRQSVNFQITLTLFCFVLLVVLVVAALFFGARASMDQSTALTSGVGFILTVIAIAIFFGVFGFLNLIMIVVNTVRAYDGKAPNYWPVIPFLR